MRRRVPIDNTMWLMDNGICGGYRAFYGRAELLVRAIAGSGLDGNETGPTTNGGSCFVILGAANGQRLREWTRYFAVSTWYSDELSTTSAPTIRQPVEFEL
jgi:hypothetical protein